MKNSSRRRKRKTKGTTYKRSYVTKNTLISLGLVFQRTINLRKTKKTDIGSFPIRIVTGFSNQRNLVMFEYLPTNENDLDIISGFFSDLEDGDAFEIPKGHGDWTDGTTKKTDVFSGTYKFKKYKNNNFIIAEKDKPLPDDFYQKVIEGKHLIRPLQFTHDRESSSKRLVSKIKNYTVDPPMSGNLEVGTVFKIEGSQNNNGQYTVIEINRDRGLETLTVSPQIRVDEDRIGMETQVIVLAENITTMDPSGITGSVYSTTNNDLDRDSLYNPIPDPNGVASARNLLSRGTTPPNTRRRGTNIAPPRSSGGGGSLY